MSKDAENSIKFRAVVIINGEEFPGESYGVTKRKISGGKIAKVFFGAVAQSLQCPRQVVIPLIGIILASYAILLMLC